MQSVHAFDSERNISPQRIARHAKHFLHCFLEVRYAAECRALNAWKVVERSLFAR